MIVPNLITVTTPTTRPLDGGIIIFYVFPVPAQPCQKGITQSLEALIYFQVLPVPYAISVVLLQSASCLKVITIFDTTRHMIITSTQYNRDDKGYPATCPYMGELQLSLSISIRSHLTHYY